MYNYNAIDFAIDKTVRADANSHIFADTEGNAGVEHDYTTSGTKGFGSFVATYVQWP